MDRDNSSARRWEYHDFELEIREGGPREYPVIVRSPEGEIEAQEEMRFPFDEGEREDKLKELSNAVRLSSVGRRRIRLPEAQTVQDFGQALFEALLRGQVGDHFDKSLREARRQNKGLRLKLRIQPPELASVPWEFLYDPGRNAYLCLSSMTPLVRYPELRETVEQLPVTLPLKILGMVASPDDLPGLQVEKEKREMRKALRDLEREGRVELKWLEGQTPRDLLRAMSRGTWHVFHFIGHGDFDPYSDEGRIVLADEECYARYLRAEDLAHLLKDHWDLRLVVLNSCEGARGSEHDAFSSTAATLVRPGIPAVLANQYEITNNAATEFSRAFYEALTDDLPVDAAVARARTSLKIEFDNTLEWGTPVLYMRSPDGRIFDISTDEEPQTRLDKLYTRARRSHQDQEWRAVVDIFDQIHALDPDYPDPKGLLVSAREELAALEHERTVTALYDQGRRHVEAEEWEQALERFQEVQRLEPGYRETERLLTRVRQELAKPPTIGVPDLTGQKASKARSTLQNRSLKLDTRNEAPSETVPKGKIIRQSPEAGTKVEAGSSVSVTVSLGPSTVEVPDLTEQKPLRARSKLVGTSLKLGEKNEIPSETVTKGKIIKQDTAAGTKAKRGSSVSITVSSGPREEKAPTVPDVRPDRRKRKGVLCAVAAVVAGLAWVGAGILSIQGITYIDFYPPLAAILIIALAGTLGGLVGLHSRQATSYGGLGLVGFLAAFVGTALALAGLLGAFLSLFKPGLLGVEVGFVLLGVGFALSGTATVRARVLPRWCGLLLIVGIFGFLGYIVPGIGSFGVGMVSGAVWLALGYALWSRRGITAEQRLRPEQAGPPPSESRRRGAPLWAELSGLVGVVALVVGIAFQGEEFIPASTLATPLSRDSISVSSAAISPDGSLLAIGGNSHNLGAVGRLVTLWTRIV